MKLSNWLMCFFVSSFSILLLNMMINRIIFFKSNLVPISNHDFIKTLIHDRHAYGKSFGKFFRLKRFLTFYLIEPILICKK